MSITIRLKRHGPYLIAVEEADQVTILDGDGNAVIAEPDRRIALCRCGGSSTKQFCDGSHRTNGFIGDVEPGATDRNSPADTMEYKVDPGALGQ